MMTLRCPLTTEKLANYEGLQDARVWASLRSRKVLLVSLMFHLEFRRCLPSAQELGGRLRRCDYHDICVLERCWS